MNGRAFAMLLMLACALAAGVLSVGGVLTLFGVGWAMLLGAAWTLAAAVVIARGLSNG